MIKVKLLNILQGKDRNLNWLSNNAGITYSTLYNFAHQNTSSVTYDILEKLCITLKCDVHDIIEFIPSDRKIIPELELEKLENAVDDIVDKMNDGENIPHSELVLLYDILIQVIDIRFKFNKQEYDRFYNIYLTCLRLLPRELSAQALQTFIANINSNNIK